MRRDKYKNETKGLKIIIIEDCWIHEDSFVISNRGRLLGHIHSCICDLIQQNYLASMKITKGLNMHNEETSSWWSTYKYTRY